MTEKKKILLVSNGFYPEISPRSFRATELAKEFHRQGYDVTVISKFRDYDYADFLKEFPVTFKMWNRPIFPKVPDFNQKPFSFISRGISRLLLLLFEYPDIEEMFQVKKILKYESGYDLMISFAVPYPVHWGVAKARTRGRRIAKIWVADCGDPYMGCLTDTFCKLFYFKYIEEWFCRKTDYISIPVESAHGGYYAEFQEKIRIIPQGFDFPVEKHVPQVINNDVPTFAYAGGFIAGIRDPGEFLEYLSSIDLDYKFIVFTKQRNMLESYLPKLDGRLEIFDYIPRHELLDKLANMDFLVNFDNNTDVQIPSKLIDYAIVGRPVLNITRGFCGDDLISFLKKDYSKKMMIPDIKQYHISLIAQKFIELEQH